MSKKLLIVGASTYSVVAYEIAIETGCFENIDFVDDVRKATPHGISVVGTTQDIVRLSKNYSDMVVAIGNSDVRLSLLDKISKETPCNVATLVSPRAYISPSAKIMSGCIIEPMAVVHAGTLLKDGCIISAGAVVNHSSVCGEGVHVDCNAVVESYGEVTAGTKICCGDVYNAINQ